MTCPDHWSSWSGEIVDEKRNEIRIHFGPEACEKCIIGFLHDGDEFRRQIFVPSAACFGGGGCRFS